MRSAGLTRNASKSWLTYAIAMLMFHIAGFVLLYALLRLQAFFPFNPQDMAAVPADLSFNTAASFISNTNWQNYGGESTLSYFTQMVGLTVQNFASAAVGIAISIAVIRRLCPCIGQFDREFLGRSHPLYACTSCCRPAWC